jgi:flagellar hook-length control protein FliK
MTTTATSTAAQSAPTNGNQATGSAAASKTAQRKPADLFSNLLGLLSATRDEPLTIGGASPLGDASADGTDPEDPNSLLSGDPQGGLTALGNAGANPLADLIGWPGAAATAAAAAASSAGEIARAADRAPSASTSAATAATSAPIDMSASADGELGHSLQGMTLLAQPTAAEPGLVPDSKTPPTTTPTASPQGNPLSSAAGVTAPKASADSDAASVRYGDTPTPKTDTNASIPVRNGDYMAARPANWRSTTTLATTSASTSSPSSASTLTAALQNAAVQQSQSIAVQRSAMADPSLPQPRNTMAPNERFSSSTGAEAVTADWIGVGAQGQAAKGETHSSGGGREDSLLAGNSLPEAMDAEAPEEVFSLDEALSTEEALDSTAFLSPNQLRHANVRVGEGTDEAIDIRLSLEGDAVNVDFRTDNAEVRAGLQHNAGASLSDLMQRGGIQLGGVSVGAQSQQSRGQSGHADSAPSRVGASSGRSLSGTRGDDTPGLETRPRAPASPRSDGGPGLDIFA